MEGGSKGFRCDISTMTSQMKNKLIETIDEHLSRKSVAPPPPATMELDTDTVNRNAMIADSKEALASYNAKNGTDYEFEEFVGAFLCLTRYSAWSHMNFKAKPRSSSSSAEIDVSSKLFFAELKGYPREFTACCVIEPNNSGDLNVKHPSSCLFCQPYGRVLHPIDGFQMGKPDDCEIHYSHWGLWYRPVGGLAYKCPLVAPAVFVGGKPSSSYQIGNPNYIGSLFGQQSSLVGRPPVVGHQPYPVYSIPAPVGGYSGYLPFPSYPIPLPFGGYIGYMPSPHGTSYSL